MNNKFLIPLALFLTQAVTANEVMMFAGKPGEMNTIEPGGFVGSKAGFQVKVMGTDGRLSLYLVSGEDFIKLGESPKDNSSTYLPSKDEVVSLDEISGKVNLVTINSDKAKQVGVNACSSKCSELILANADTKQAFEVVSENVEVINLTGGKKVSASEKMKIPTFDISKRVLALSESINKGSDLDTRGANEVRIYKEISPSVVLIINEESDSLGTGSVIFKDKSSAQILTNYHVVKGAKRVKVFIKKTKRGSMRKADAYIADVIKVHPEGDLALLKINESITAPKIAIESKMGDLEIGQDVHAIGHPKGEFWTYTKGYVSQLRDNYKWQTDDGKHKADLIIQTQTPINTGNSGGPLLNDQGQMVGVNSFKGEGEGMNYAISSEDVVKFLNNKELTATPPEKKKDDVEIIRSKEDDIDGDGVKETILAVDLNGDGKGDGVVIVNKAKNDRIFLLDANNDGNFEAKFVDRENDGTFDIFLRDDDEDGKWDVIGFDKNGDGEPDKFEKI